MPVLQICSDRPQGRIFEDITPKMADYVYENTAKGSKLRRYVVDWVLEVCPLGDGDYANTGLHHLMTVKEREEMQREWRYLVERKWDLVADVALRGSWLDNSWDKALTERAFVTDDIEYFEPIHPVEDFLEG